MVLTMFPVEEGYRISDKLRPSQDAAEMRRSGPDGQGLPSVVVVYWSLHSYSHVGGEGHKVQLISELYPARSTMRGSGEAQ